MFQHLTEQNFQVIIRVRPLNSKQHQQIQSYQYAQSKKFKNSSNNKIVKLSPQAYAFYTKFYNVANLSDIIKIQNHSSIYVIDTQYKNTQRKMKSFTFSNVYSNQQTSQQIFQQSIFQPLNCIFNGFNYTILAYGITGSGKTHTVFGNHQKNHKGISGLALNYLLKKKKQIQKDHSSKVNLGFSFVQIYNQNVRDLLNSQGKMLNIIQDAKGNTSFTDAIQIQIHNQDQIHDLINIGLAKRSSGATMANQYSSRSHAILQMNVQIITQNNRINSKMFIIDLAGSEKIQTLNTAKKMLQGANINKSLLALGNCINILAQNSKKGMNNSGIHIPYRDSKLTRILKDSLGGNAKTLMIACVSQNPFTIQETITTLNYAQRAQGIKKQVKRNKSLQDEQKKICSQCAKEMNAQSGITIYNKIKLLEILRQSTTTGQKQEMFVNFFQQIYEDITQNIKQRVSIDRVLVSQNCNKTSLEDVQKLRDVNQNQRVQLKQTMWKLFLQKQQDYQQKISQLNQFIQNFNNQQERLEKTKLKQKSTNIQLIGPFKDDQNNSDIPNFSRSKSIQKNDNNDKFRSYSITRKPLQQKLNNQQDYSLKYNDSAKLMHNQNEKPIIDENSHVRFSFASLLTSDVIKTQLQNQPQIDKGAQKNTKRKKSRTKFQVVKRMSASKLDSKQLGQVSV